MKKETLGDALPREISRCQDLLVVYEKIGPAGQFAALMLRESLDAAAKAMVAGDLPAMIVAYGRLRDHE